MSGKSNAAEKKEEAPVEAAAKKPGLPAPLVKIAILGGILVVLAAGSLALVVFVIGPKLRASGPPPAAATGEHGEAVAGAHGEKGDGAKGHGKEKHEHGEVVELGDIVVNPAGTGGRRYLKASVSIEVKDAKVAKTLEHRSAPIKDLLVRQLSARTLEELLDPVTKEEMREQLVEEIDGLFPDGTVLNVFFTEYVVQ